MRAKFKQGQIVNFNGEYIRIRTKKDCHAGKWKTEINNEVCYMTSYVSGPNAWIQESKLKALTKQEKGL